MKKNGFTLMELMVVIGLFGVLITILTTVVIKAIQGANQATIQNDVRQNAQRVFGDVGDEIRQSGCMQYSVSGNSSTLKTFSDSTCTVLVATFTSDGAAKTFTKTTPTGGTVNLLSSKVAAVSCGVVGAGCGSTSCSTNGFSVTSYDGSALTSGANWTNAIKVNLTVQQVPGTTRSDFCGSINLIDTFTPRN